MRSGIVPQVTSDASPNANEYTKGGSTSTPGGHHAQPTQTRALARSSCRPLVYAFAEGASARPIIVAMSEKIILGRTSTMSSQSTKTACNGM